MADGHTNDPEDEGVSDGGEFGVRRQGGDDVPPDA